MPSKLAQDFADDTTLHGVPETLMETNKYLKIAWILCLLLVAAVMGREVVSVVNEYRAEPVAVSVVGYSPTIYPDLLYCPSAWANPYRMAQLGIDDEMYLYLLGALPDASTNEMYENPVFKSQGYSYASALNKFSALNLSIDRVVDLIAYRPEEFIISFTSYPDGTVELTDKQMVKTMSGMCYKMGFGGFQFSNMELNIGFVVFYLPAREPHLTTAFGLDNLDTFSLGGRSEIYDSKIAATPDEKYPLGRNFSVTIRFELMLVRRPNLRRRKCKRDSVESQSICASRHTNKLCKSAGHRPTYIPLSESKVSEVANRADPTQKYCLDEIELPENLYSEICPGPCSATMSNIQQILVDSTTPHVHPNLPFPLVAVVLSYTNALMSLSFQEYEAYTTDSLISNVGGLISLGFGASMITLAQVICFFTVQRGQRSNTVGEPGVRGHEDGKSISDGGNRQRKRVYYTS